jgi:hypothetical protein
MIRSVLVGQLSAANEAGTAAVARAATRSLKVARRLAGKLMGVFCRYIEPCQAL